MSKFTLQQVYTAYRRLKNHFYFDNSNLPMRMKIAEFESNLNFVKGSSRKKPENFQKDEIKNLFLPIVDQLNNLYDLMVSTDETKSVLEVRGALKPYLDQIGCYPIPKELESKKEVSGYHFITNQTSKGEIKVKKCNFMIDAPIFIHIVSVLWVEMVGVKLHPYIEKNNYAYRLNVSENEQDQTYKLKEGLTLFQPYFIGYQTWRDKALNEAKRLLNAGNDVTLLSLDVKRYYYSARINVLDVTKEAIEQEVLDKDRKYSHFLNILLQQIHEAYQIQIESYLDAEYRTSEENIERRECVLPVGLLSSAVLANFYLHKFDEFVVKSVAPSYYGRYVDDIIFVFSNRGVDKTDDEQDNPVDKFLNRYFCDVDVLVETTTDDPSGKTYIVNVSGERFNDQQKKQIIASDFSFLGNIKVQTKKVVLEYFDHKGSHAAIDIFLRNLSKNRSEYRFLPTEDVMTEEFDKEAFQLLYDDSVNKIRSVKVFNEDKYGAAKYLAKQIYLLRLKEQDEDCSVKKRNREKVALQLIAFFSGRNAIYMYALWERVATYFVLSKDCRSLFKFYYHVKKAIRKTSWSESADGDLQQQLERTLHLSIAMPMALCPQFMKSDFLTLTEEYQDLNKLSLLFRRSNMFRNNYVALKGINLTKVIYKENVDLTDDDVSILKSIDTIKGLCWMSPKFIRFEELNLLQIYSNINANKKEKHKGKSSKVKKELTPWKDYVDYSRNWIYLFSGPCGKDKSQEDADLVKITPGGIEIKDHDFAEVKCESDKIIAIVNKKIEPSHFMSVVKYHTPIRTTSRKQELVGIINDTIRQGAEMLIMPELTVPFAWLTFLVEIAMRSDIAIVTGMEYCLDAANNRIANFVVTILPFRDELLKSCFVRLREKNFYSPKEGLLLDAYHYNFRQEEKAPVYDLFHWRKCYFSVFNCFELADITSRSQFKSKVDFIIAVEYNKDVRYFSDVVGSWARDIHCFIVQVNSSDYGDSKIITPSKTEEKTLVHVKGGINTVVLTCKLPVSSLRDFQLASYGEQINDKRFKFTPPGFDHDCALRRHNNKSVYLDEK